MKEASGETEVVAGLGGRGSAIVEVVMWCLRGGDQV